MSIKKDQESDPAVTFNNHIDSDHKTAGYKDLPMHSDRFELNLWVLWYAWLDWADHYHENDGWD